MQVMLLEHHIESDMSWRTLSVSSVARTRLAGCDQQQPLFSSMLLWPQQQPLCSAAPVPLQLCHINEGQEAIAPGAREGRGHV